MRTFNNITYIWIFVLMAVCAGHAGTFPWQQPYAEVLPGGDLKPAQQPYEFKAGENIRYIDFENGDDRQDGASPETAWKHHPWDPNATADAGEAAPDADIDTYVFKGGVIYRGRLNHQGQAGTPDRPIRFATDPGWGMGMARIYGSEQVRNWTRGAHAKMPDGQTIWQADVRFLPRTLWQVDAEGAITRLHLARDPNWTVSDPREVLSEWPTWEQPEWWKNRNIVKVNGKKRHLGIDERLKGLKEEDLVGATVWTEWGIVMGSPYPAEVEAYDADQGGVAFRGPWTYDLSQKIITGNRYFLENKPQWLDEPGEFWVERLEENRARIYVRLPDDIDPNRTTIEAGARTTFLKSDELRHIDISGLHFRFSNVHWDYNIPQWGHDDLRDAVIRLAGGGDGLRIHHNIFEHVNTPIRISASAQGYPYAGSPIGSVFIHDNTIRHTEHRGVVVAAHSQSKDKHDGPLEHVELLRNTFYDVGIRPLSGGHGHAVDIRFPKTALVAGNFLHRIAGWGISIYGGKDNRHTYESPFSRYIITQNRVEDVLLKVNDYGGIETWQGGSFYVYNNVVINPRGFKHWIHIKNLKDRVPAFGHAYYLDGSYKNYLFNNIARGLNNTPAGKYANMTALQGIWGFENTFFHNSFYKFAEMVRKQSPGKGRTRYLSNIMQDSSLHVFRNADPKEGSPDPNAAHYAQGGDFAYETMAFDRNAFSEVGGKFGVFEETGVVYEDAAGMREALKRAGAQAPGLGKVVDQSVLRAPGEQDFRPVPGAADGLASKVFVPWGLYGAAGEWPFTLNRRDPTRIIDEHWNMTRSYVDREDYRHTPRYPLRGVNIDAGDYRMGVLEDWAPSALTLNGEDQYLFIEHDTLVPEVPEMPEFPIVEVETEIGTFFLPEKIYPGETLEVKARLKEDLGDNRLRVDMHWLSERGYGGISDSGAWEGAKPVPGEPNTYVITLELGEHRKLNKWNVVGFITPDGGWGTKLIDVKFNIPAAEPYTGPRPEEVQTVAIDTTPVLIEAYFKTTDGDGVLVQKKDGSGYQLTLESGRLSFDVQNQDGTSLSVQSNTRVNNGKWQHLIAELDRDKGLTLYLNGKPHAQTRGNLPGTLENTADFYVGGTPDGDHLSVTLDFLRVARGTLADAKTTIEELYAWQFDGPFLRDFRGEPRDVEKGAAGAIEQR